MIMAYLIKFPFVRGCRLFSFHIGGLADRKRWLISMQVGSILKNHVGYGAILSWNSSVLLQCLQEYLETEEQWLFYLLAEKTGTTKVSIITLWHQHFPTIKNWFHVWLYCQRDKNNWARFWISVLSKTYSQRFNPELVLSGLHSGSRTQWSTVVSSVLLSAVFSADMKLKVQPLGQSFFSLCHWADDCFKSISTIRLTFFRWTIKNVLLLVFFCNFGGD